MSTTTPTPSAVEVSIEEQSRPSRSTGPRCATRSTTPCAAELIGILDRLGSDDAVRALVLTGKGKAFCAGGDIAGMQQSAARRRPAKSPSMAGGASSAPTTRIVAAARAAASRPSPRSTARPRASAATWRCAATSSWHPTAASLQDELHPARPRSPTAAACTSCRAGSACRAPRS